MSRTPAAQSAALTDARVFTGSPNERQRCHADDVLDGFFEGKVASLREAYIHITGDKRVTGRTEDVNWNRFQTMTFGAFREAVDTTTFANVLGAAVARHMVADYRIAQQHAAVWRKVARAVRLEDFRTQQIVRMGHYATPLPTVPEGAPYEALVTPSDRVATYAATKRGGTEDITLEMIANDDARVAREIPKRLALAAARTLNDFVLDFLRTNPTIFDSVALFHASHGNLGNAALSAVSLYAGWVAMSKQVEIGSGQRMVLRPKTLLVPLDLEETANNLLVRNTNNDRFYIQAQGIEPVAVKDWTDSNDWVLAADPGVFPSIEVGFFAGREEPELFLQNAPNSGSLFSHDRVTLKIRHIYGGAVSGFEGLYKSVVT